MVAPLGIRSRQGAAAHVLADDTVVRWQAIEAALAPILGSLGVAALHRRSLYLAAQTYPWLALEAAADAPPLDLQALRTALAAREAEEAAAASQCLLQCFQGLLSSLIGPSLAERLLGALWSSPLPSGRSAQDNPP